MLLVLLAVCRKLNTCGLKLISVEISVDICCGFNKCFFFHEKDNEHHGPREMSVGFQPSIKSYGNLGKEIF